MRFDEPVALTLGADGKTVVEADDPGSVIGEGPLQVADGVEVEIVGLEPGQFITVNGLMVESGRLRISHGTPRFEGDGTILIDDLCTRDTIPIDIRAEVRRVDGEVFALPLYEDEPGDLACHATIPGTDRQGNPKTDFFFWLERNNKGEQLARVETDAEYVTATLITDPFGDFAGYTLSETEHPPGFRFARRTETKYGPNETWATYFLFVATTEPDSASASPGQGSNAR